MNAEPCPCFTLRQLPLAGKLVVATFLLSVGLGYFSALVQLHFQHAKPGQPLPDAEDVVRAYHGLGGISQFERLLVEEETKPFNGSGTMRPAFTVRSAGWNREIMRRARAKGYDTAPDQEAKDRLRQQAVTELRQERDGERLAVLQWIRAGFDQQSFDNDEYVPTGMLREHPITAEFAEFIDENGPDKGKIKFVKIKSIVEKRCARCHSANVGGSAAQFPLDTWEEVAEYCRMVEPGGGMSLEKLAQSTHAHLLTFCVLFGLTGLTFAFTSYPCVVRSIVGPFTLLAQVTEIAFWWAARAHPSYARGIVVTGSLVGLSLGIQIVGSLVNMFDKVGKLVLLALFLIAAVAGVLLANQVIIPYLSVEALMGGPSE
ncbi:MAG: hypothetical protein NZ700_02995 [Gemmataceae bacterium]|nr:hypothetical protein [Gemmataceae bacterium]MDW8265896.1 hypothetical protein [Gemmataceae bacterium]